MPAGKVKKSSCSHKVKRLDGFGREFKFHLPGEVTETRSWSGLVVTFICFILIIFYSLMQMIKFAEFGEPIIMVSVRDSFLDADYKFSSDQGFLARLRFV